MNFVTLLRNAELFQEYLNGSKDKLSDRTPNKLQLILATDSKASNKFCVPSMPRGPGDELLPA